MIIETILEYLRNNPKQAFIIKLSIIVFIIFLVVTLLINIPTSRLQNIVITGLPDDATPTLNGNEVYYYNGMSFIQTSLDTGKSSSISSSYRLPLLNNVYFMGSKGVIFNFNGNTQSTLLEEYAKSIDTTEADDEYSRNLFWYLDFSTKEISVLLHGPISPNSFYYDQSSETAYYVATPIPEIITEDDASKNSHNQTLYRLKINSTTSEELAKFPDIILDIKSLSPCGDDNNLCIVAESEHSYNLFQYNNDKIENILTTPNRIFYTNNQSKFVLADQLTYYGDVDNESDGKKIVSKISEYDIRNKKESSLGISANNITNLIPLYNKSSLTLYANFGHTELQTIHRSPSIVLLPNISKSSKKVDNPGHLVDKVKSYSYADNSMIFSRYDGSVAYAGPGKLPAKPKTPPTQLVQGCVQQHGSEVEYTAMHSLYTLYVPVSGAFAATIEQIGDCILKNPNDTFGYMFQIMGTSPESGRIITN